MKPIKVLIVLGTRPEAIKLAPVIHTLRRNPLFELSVLSTGQHRELLHQMVDIFDLKLDFDLDIMSKAQNLAQSSARILEKMHGVLEVSQPNFVLVQGDTTSTAMGALSAFYQKIAVGHVEAGLRTGDKFQPYPEEVNRKITSAIADLHFAPTKAAGENLLRENVPSENIFITGNTVVDSLLLCLEDDFHFSNDMLNDLVSEQRKYIVVTTHRRENFGEPLKNIIEALLQAAERYPDFEFVIPVHLNPNVRSVVQQNLANHPRIHLTESMDYKSFINLLRHSSLILTDSGGIQEEAPTLRKKTLILREVTERPEGLNTGYLKLVGWKKENILRALDEILASLVFETDINLKANPYGDGAASDRIAAAILYHFGRVNSRPANFEPNSDMREAL